MTFSQSGLVNQINALLQRIPTDGTGSLRNGKAIRVNEERGGQGIGPVGVGRFRFGIKKTQGKYSPAPQ